jgi:hypothetical protein
MAKIVKAKRSAAPRGLPDKPQEPPRRDPRLKKIYVYKEGTFALHNAAEVHKLVIKTPAFDLGGWLDMSRMRPSGDRIFVEIRAWFANRSNVLFRRMVFESPLLVSVGDFSTNLLSGNHIELWFQQELSADNFATPVEIAYQLIVESA